MRSTLLLLIAALTACSASAQIVAVQRDSGYIAYVGCENPLSIAVEGYTAKALIVKTDNGSVSGDNGQYIITPQYPRDSISIFISAITSNGIKQVKTFKMKLDCVRLEQTSFAGRQSGTVPASLARYTWHLKGNIEGIDFEPHFHITGCKIVVIRDGLEILRKTIFNQKGFSFQDDPVIGKVFDSFKPGDVLKFSNITYLGYGECTGTMKPMEIILN